MAFAHFSAMILELITVINDFFFFFILLNIVISFKHLHDLHYFLYESLSCTINLDFPVAKINKI